MEDPAIPGAGFALSDRASVEDARWWNGGEGEPLWVTAERAGLSTASVYWPGSEAVVRGIRPRRWLTFDAKATTTARVDQLLAWLDEPSPPRFATLYLDPVDTAGHDFGPGSPEVDAAITNVDAGIARLVEGLSKRGLMERTNLIVVADHGMASVSRDRIVWLDDVAPVGSFRTISSGARAAIVPTPGREAEAARLIGKHPHAECWRKADMPARFHYGRNARVAPIICLAETGWEMTVHDGWMPKGGDHGFDPADPQMRAVFVAKGPDFPIGETLEAFDNVDVYPLFARLLGVKPQSNDGRPGGPAGLKLRP